MFTVGYDLGNIGPCPAVGSPGVGKKSPPAGGHRVTV
jgi:hypothetical protein